MSTPQTHGNTGRITYAVDPSNGSTAVSVIVTAPNGATSTPTPTLIDTAGTKRTWEALVLWTAPGVWLAEWTSTGEGAGTKQDIIPVRRKLNAAIPGSYATVVDLVGWTLTDEPDNAEALLVAASRFIRDATMTAVYDVDDGDLPTDPVTLKAFKDAVCAQAATWAALSIDPTKGAAGDTGVAVQKSIGSASIQRQIYQITAQAKAEGAYKLSDDAARILTAANLLNQRPWVTG